MTRPRHFRTSRWALPLALAVLVCAAACSSTPDAAPSTPSPPGVRAVRVLVGGQAFTAELYDNPTARDLGERLPVTLTVDDLNGVEKTGRLPFALTTDGVPRGADPELNEIGYYAPGRDLVLYYGDVGYFTGIIRIGRFRGASPASATYRTEPLSRFDELDHLKALLRPQRLGGRSWGGEGPVQVEVTLAEAPA